MVCSYTLCGLYFIINIFLKHIQIESFLLCRQEHQRQTNYRLCFAELKTNVELVTKQFILLKRFVHYLYYSLQYKACDVYRSAHVVMNCSLRITSCALCEANDHDLKNLAICILVQHAS